MDFKIQNKLNIWKFQDCAARWYRPDLKVRNFFRKIKWTWQRAKYGYCDKDLWSLDYALGNYIASATNKLSKKNHSHPYSTTEKEWDDILKNISINFYMGVNEDCYDNIYEKVIASLPSVDQTDEQREMWKRYSEREIDIANLMAYHRKEGFKSLEKWFPNLWD